MYACTCSRFYITCHTVYTHSIRPRFSSILIQSWQKTFFKLIYYNFYLIGILNGQFKSTVKKLNALFFILRKSIRIPHRRSSTTSFNQFALTARDFEEIINEPRGTIYKIRKTFHQYIKKRFVINTSQKFEI